jgi:hypothetical protein
VTLLLIVTLYHCSFFRSFRLSWEAIYGWRSWIRSYRLSTFGNWFTEVVLTVGLGGMAFHMISSDRECALLCYWGLSYIHLLLIPTVWVPSYMNVMCDWSCLLQHFKPRLAMTSICPDVDNIPWSFQHIVSLSSIPVVHLRLPAPKAVCSKRFGD